MQHGGFKLNNMYNYKITSTNKKNRKAMPKGPAGFKCYLKPVKLAVVSALLVVLAAGCGKDKENFLDGGGMALPLAGVPSDGNWYCQDYLSEDVCVIPAGRQNKNNRNFTASSVLLVNTTKNEVVYASNIYDRLYPASVTKIVTALVALKYGNLDDIVTISYEASHITEYGAKLCGFNEGDKVKLEKLLYALMVYSGNDAGIAIAEHISGSTGKFAKLMNKEMEELGAVGSHFTNPHGLHDDNHYTTAYDLYLVFNKLISDYPEFTDIINKGSVRVKYKDASGQNKEMDFTSTVKYNINTETAPEGVEVTGGKTGTTQMAGSNLILHSKDADGDSYISAVMHASDSYSLYDQMNYLLSMEGRLKNNSKAAKDAPQE